MFTSLRLTQVHNGNSFRALQNFFENRTSVLAQSMINKLRFQMLQSAETARRKEAPNYRLYSRTFRKYLFGKTNRYENFSTMHSSVATRAFAFIGIDNSFKSSPTASNNAVVFKMDSFKAKSKASPFISNKTKTITFSTHLSPASSDVNYFLPLSSLYERSGHFKTLDGKIRKHQKVVGKHTRANNLDSVFSFFCRRQGVNV